MRVGYCVAATPLLASYRLRVAIPAPHIGLPYAIGTTGDPTFFYKNGNVRLAESCGRTVYDVVNDHFKGASAPDYHGMCSVATAITCGSEAMRQIIADATGRDATVIDDPWENDEQAPAVVGNGVAWFGHSANVKSLVPYLDKVRVVICSNIAHAHVPWSLDSEARVLRESAVVLITGASPGASSNRIVKALRAGRFVVCPADCAEGWRQFEPYIWIGDVREGIAWALNNRGEACNKILAGQHYIRERFSPQLIGSQWRALFDSI